MKPIELARKILKKQSNPIGAFCLTCGKPCEPSKEEEGEEHFICKANATHTNPRALIFDPKIPYALTDDYLTHQTVGIIVIKKQKTPYFLLFLRRRFPFQYTIPAGHVENGISLKENAIRETKEETSLFIKQINQLWPKETLLFTDPCRRGADCHQWHVFEVEPDGYPRLSEEGRIIGWYTQEEIKLLRQNHLITEASYTILHKYWRDHLMYDNE